jgi:hypothetical protein
MKKLLLIGLLAASCQEQEIKPKEKSMTFVSFHNLTPMTFNYSDGCEANIIMTGATKYLTCGSDTICSFKVDAAGIISWKARQGHVVTLGDCTYSSLKIHQ